MQLDRSQRLQRKGCRAVTGLGPSSCNCGRMRWSSALNQVMTSLTQAEVLIALVVAAHAGVLAVRLAASLYRA